MCPIAAMGEILRLGGGFLHMLFHDISLQWPSFTFCSASSLQHRAASGSHADLDGPFLIAASISSMVQFGPQSTGQPFVAYLRSSSAAGCLSAAPFGRISPTKASFSVDAYLLCDSDS